MPVDYEIDREGGVVRVTASGGVSDADLFAFARRVAADPELDVPRPELCDFRHARAADLSAATVRELAEIFAETDAKRAGRRVALVCPGDTAYGLARMYQAHREGGPHEIRVFRDLAAARTWLAIPA